MGVVIGATHVQLGQPVAIKFMSPVLLEDGTRVQRFMQEAQAAAHIQSEHVVRVFDAASLDDGTPYIVMEYLEGEDLQEVLQRRGPLPLPEAVRHVLQACEAVAEAHAAGIVHRDLKPGNLFRCRRRDGSVLIKVLDFGISKLLPKAKIRMRDRAATGAHVVMGSPSYASPEQLGASRDVDARTDVWSLAATLYALVAGRPPFPGTTLLEIRARVTYDEPIPLSTLRPDVPREFESALARGLAKAPRKRFQAVAQFAEAILPFAPRPSVLSSERIAHAEGGPSSVGPSAIPCGYAGAVGQGPRQAPLWVTAVIAIVVVVWTALWWNRPGPVGEAPSAAVGTAPPIPRATLTSASDLVISEPASGPMPTDEVPALSSSRRPSVRHPASAPAPSHRAPETSGFGGLL
jgi:serine/threonine-protein kinase